MNRSEGDARGRGKAGWVVRKGDVRQKTKTEFDFLFLKITIYCIIKENDWKLCGFRYGSVKLSDITDDTWDPMNTAAHAQKNFILF